MKKLIKNLFFCVVAAILAVAVSATAAPVEPGGLSAKEFSRLIQDMSEEGGYFFSDNFTSNEDSYLTVVDKMRQLGATGGAYIGVGPEQNFTYIAKVRPVIAFIVDIRRQAMIQHLMYKAIFHLSPTRDQFISLLLSRPIPAGKAPNASINDLIAFFSNIPGDEKAYAKNLAEIRKTIQQGFLFPLTSEDQAGLEHVYRNFKDRGFDIGFDINGGGWGRNGRFGRFGRLPSLKEILAQKDLNGKPGNFLASVDDYNFVRGLQLKNLVIPVVGDFSGKKALASIGDYLKKRKITVSVFYLSNVEIVLLDWGSVAVFSNFVENVKRLPTDARTLLIRSTFSYYGHPASRQGYALCTLLQKAPVFLRDFNEGRYRSYWDLIITNYIAP